MNKLKIIGSQADIHKFKSLKEKNLETTVCKRQDLALSCLHLQKEPEDGLIMKAETGRLLGFLTTQLFCIDGK